MSTKTFVFNRTMLSQLITGHLYARGDMPMDGLTKGFAGAEFNWQVDKETGEVECVVELSFDEDPVN